MTVTAAFADLEQQFSQLDRVVSNVVWAVVQVRPTSPAGQSIANHYESATLDFSDLVKTARQAAHTGQQATADHADLETIRQALVTCQECANQIVQRYYGDIASCERIEDLHDLSKRGSRDWAKWVLGVRDGLSSCPQILHTISESLLHCWQEITEPIGPMSVTAQATSVGSRIVIRGHHESDSSPSNEPFEETLRVETSP